MKIHIDIETYSSIDLKKTGVYKYIESPDFEILLIAYALGTGPVKVLNLRNGDLKNDPAFLLLLTNAHNEKHAHNATFERLALNKFFDLNLPPWQWHCSMVKAAYCGLPLGLDKVSEVLNLGDKGKLQTGTLLINYFCKPCEPRKANEGRTRNLPEHDDQKWDSFKMYCKNDVEAEREVSRVLEPYEFPIEERAHYLLDQEINDRGVLIDTDFAQKATNYADQRQVELMQELKDLTGLENPNSDAQLKGWLSDQGIETESLAKDAIIDLLEEHCAGAVNTVLKLRQKSKKTSTKKYVKMLDSACADQRGRGYFQFYGANRTGRWAGRFVQLQNLPQNHLSGLDTCRDLVAFGDYDLFKMNFDDVTSTLSQLIRTAFIAKEGHTFAVADFAQIEARVLAWIAGAEWKLKVFREGKDIYKASAASMFGRQIDEVSKDDRQLGKISELALGYGGSVGALAQMEKSVFGANHEPIPEGEKKKLVTKWRAKNPEIVRFWARVDGAAKRALRTKRPIHVESLIFLYDSTYLTIELPSGRKLFYYQPTFTVNRWGGESIRYRGLDQETKQWSWIETYGGKLTENICQAISRDLLAYSMQKINNLGYDLVMHVHDEAVSEVPEIKAASTLDRMCELMAVGPEWSEGLPLKAAGFISKYYKKD